MGRQGAHLGVPQAPQQGLVKEHGAGCGETVPAREGRVGVLGPGGITAPANLQERVGQDGDDRAAVTPGDRVRDAVGLSPGEEQDMSRIRQDRLRPDRPHEGTRPDEDDAVLRRHLFHALLMRRHLADVVVDRQGPRMPQRRASLDCGHWPYSLRPRTGTS
jgi:hypothetical protein